MPMTAAACDDAERSGSNTAAVQCANTKLINHCQHSAPVISGEDHLALKRQRVKSFQNITSTDSACDDDHLRRLNDDQNLPVNNEDILQKDSEGHTSSSPEHDVQDRGLQGVPNPPTAAFLLGCFAEPLLAAMFGEAMSGYFQRLRATLVAPLSCGQALMSIEADGIYVQKRPIRAPNGANPLAVCGSVLHHVVVFVKKGSLLHSLDYGPANGADVTANILEDAPCKRVLLTVTATSAPASVASGDSSGGSGNVVSDELPYLYLGPAAREIDDPMVQQMITFTESRRYHALSNNCIHFADVAVRVMTGGAVRNAPLLYDTFCGTVPLVDKPMLMMLQLMLRMSWFVVVDGSPLAAAFRDHWQDVVQRQQRSNSAPPEPLTLAETPPLAPAAQCEAEGRSGSELATEVVAEVDTA